MASLFPIFIADDLNGRVVHVPADYAGQHNLILIAFSIEQQAAVNTWLPFADWLMEAVPGVEYYEHPVVADYERRRKKTIDGWMRMGIRDKAVRARTITLYTDMKGLCSALDLPGPSQNATLLIDHRGQIVWQVTGIYRQGWGQAISDLLHASPPPETF